MYLHTKGVRFNGNHKGVKDWVDLMKYFLITNYKCCLYALRKHDVVGVNYRTDPMPHFSGNFWWSKGSHIKKLLPLENDGKYLSPEMWICGTHGKYFCLHESGVNHYEEEYPLCKYNMVSRYKSYFETRKYDSPTTGIYVGLC